MGDLGREPTKGAFQSRAFGCQQKVTGPLLLRKLFPQLILASVVKGCHMKTTTSMRIRASRFISDRYAYRERPNYFAELAAFGIIVIIASWPILSLANAIATLR